MKLSLLKAKEIFIQQLPEKIQGQFWVTHNDAEGYEEKLISIEALEGQWEFKSTKKVHLLDEHGNKLSRGPLEALKVYSLLITKTNEIVHIFSEPITTDRQTYKKYTMPTHKKIRIGRGEGCDIQYKNKYVSSQHAELTIEGNQITVTSLSQSNATYLNDQAISHAALKPGDVIQIIGLKIIITNDFIAMNNPDKLVVVNQNTFTRYSKQLLQSKAEDDDFDVDDEEHAYRLFYKSPKFKKGIQLKEIRIDTPPAPNNREETPLLLAMGPSFTMGIAAIATATFTLQYTLNNNGNMRFVYSAIIMAVSMLIGTILFPILMRRHERKKKNKFNQKRMQKYEQYLASVQQEITEESIVQSSILHQNHFSVEECANHIQSESSDVWHVTKDSPDFLRVRLGKGERPLQATIKFPDKRFSLEDDDLQEKLFEFKDEQKMLTNVPITMSLLEDRVTGIVGDEQQAKALANSMIVQLSALHGYDEMQMVFLYDKKEQAKWNFVKWLPHAWSTDEKVRFVATDSVEVKELFSALEQEYSKRLDLPSEVIQEQLPHMVFFSLDPKLTKKANLLTRIAKEKRNLGYSIVFIEKELVNLPKDCTKVLQLEDSKIRVFDKKDLTGEQQLVYLETYKKQDEEQLSRKLANLRLSTLEASYTLPERLTFLEMFEVGKIEHLNPSARWKNNDPTTSLETRIGIDTTGEWMYLDLHEKFHGPHGLIAGMTGSGKSEFIMTYILSLAVNYHPDEVAFILIDYKGGGMANTFSNLPHVAGKITNLDGAAVNRSLISIESELKRRQAIFSEVGYALEMSNLDIYKYQKLYREGKVDKPLPHLFIISDEFAELKTQQPEFMEQLISAARIGRSLGVHLILATQKPSGVVNDQIWSNSKFRISLKVQERADSMDMIKRPDAAELTVTGRYYLQVGYNEIFKMGQSAWSGAAYYPEDVFNIKEEDQITLIDTTGQVLTQVRESKKTSEQQGNQIEQITKYLAMVAQEEHVQAKPIWLEPIPEVISLTELKETYDITDEILVNPLIGEVDDPELQRRLPLTLNLVTEGNVIVYGAVGGGKTMFLTTMITSLMQSYSPDQVNVYILDFASGILSGLKNAPHVGDVVTSDESEKVTNLFDMLSKELEARKKRFAQAGGDYVSYIKEGHQVPLIVVAIHNYTAFSELYIDKENELTAFTREGLKYGITFILTGLNASSVRYKVAQNFKQQFVLQQNDISDYSSILGNVGGVYPSQNKGRGIYKTDKVYEFQIAQVLEETTNSELRALSEQQLEKWPNKRAKAIPVLPDVVDLDYVQTVNLSNVTPIGVERQSLQLATLQGYDEERSAIHFITAQALENQAVMQGIIGGIAHSKPAEMLVIDPEKMLNLAAGDYDYIDANFDEAVMRIYKQLVYRNNTYKDAREAAIELPKFERLTCVIVSLKAFYNRMSPEVQSKMKALLERVEKEYRVHFIIFEAQADVTSYNIEPWFKSRVKDNEAIWIGNGLDGMRLPKLTSMRGYEKEVAENFGYVVKAGKPTLVKLITTGGEKYE